MLSSWYFFEGGRFLCLFERSLLNIHAILRFVEALFMTFEVCASANLKRFEGWTVIRGMTAYSGGAYLMC